MARLGQVPPRVLVVRHRRQREAHRVPLLSRPVCARMKCVALGEDSPCEQKAGTKMAGHSLVADEGGRQGHGGRGQRCRGGGRTLWDDSACAQVCLRRRLNPELLGRALWHPPGPHHRRRLAALRTRASLESVRAAVSALTAPQDATGVRRRPLWSGGWLVTSTPEPRPRAASGAGAVTTAVDGCGVHARSRRPSWLSTCARSADFCQAADGGGWARKARAVARERFLRPPARRRVERVQTVLRACSSSFRCSHRSHTGVIQIGTILYVLEHCLMVGRRLPRLPHPEDDHLTEL